VHEVSRSRLSCGVSAAAGVVAVALALAAATWLAASCAEPNHDAGINDPDAYGSPASEDLGPGDAPDIPYWHSRDTDNPDFLCTRCHPNQHNNQYRAPDGCLYCHDFES
jgi:hypothetical protein